MELQLMGYRLATAEITYHMPDHPAILQTLVWQHYDLAPEFPVSRNASITGAITSRASFTRSRSAGSPQCGSAASAAGPAPSPCTEGGAIVKDRERH